MIILFYIALFLYISTISIIPTIIDYDFWARIVVGKTFFQTGKLLNFDFQSFGPTRQWFDHEWGSSIIFYQILDKFGDKGIFIFKAVTIFMVYFIITRIILLRRKHLSKTEVNPFKSAPLNILFFIFLIQSTLDVVFTTVRCHMLSFLFFMLWFYALEKSRLENNYRILWVLPVSMIMWANIHGGCFTGLGLLFIYTVGEFLNKKPCKPYVLVGIFSVFAMFINPYGVKYVYFLFSAITMDRPTITEWVSIFNKIHFTKYLKYKIWMSAVAFLTATILIKKYIKIDAKTVKEKLAALYNSIDKTKAITLIIMFLLSIKTLRLIPFFAFTAAVFLYDDIYKLFNKKLPNIINNLKEIFLYILIAVSFLYTNHVLKMECTLIQYPYREAEFLKINNLKGNLFANFHYGSYLAYKLYPDNFIFMDGRYEETYDPELLSRMRIMFIGPNWKEEFYKQHIDYILVEKEYILYERLSKDSDWKLVINSKDFALFINKNIDTKNLKMPPENIEYYNKTRWQTNIDWSTGWIK